MKKILSAVVLVLMTACAHAQFPGSGQTVTTIPNNSVMSNISGGTANPIGNTQSAVIDSMAGTTARGAMLIRGASGWTALTPGSAGNVLTSNGTGADPSYQAAAGGGVTMPAKTIRCNNTTSSAAESNCTFIVTAQTTKWFQNDSPVANINRFGDRVFIGDAVNFNAINGDTGGADWFSALQCSTLIGCGAYYSLSQVIIEAGGSGSSGNSMNGILAVTQNTNCSGFCSAIGGAFFGVNNRSSGAGNVYAVYGECDALVSNSSQCVAGEFDIVSKANIGANPNPFQQDFLVGLQNACGGEVGTFDCGAAMQIVANGKSWHAGIIVLDGALANNNFGWPNAFSMRSTYRISWFSSSSTVAGTIYAGNGGTINLDPGGGTIATNGNNGATCGSGINTTSFRSVNGLVTAC